MDDNIIDSIAALEKFEIENSRYTRDQKELEKSKVDFVSSVLKSASAHPVQNITVMGLSIEQVREIKQIAKQCAIEKVVLFPNPNGQPVSLIRAYGGDKERFFQYMGWTNIKSNTPMEFLSICDSLAKEYGVILYESN